MPVQLPMGAQLQVQLRVSLYLRLQVAATGKAAGQRGGICSSTMHSRSSFLRSFRPSAAQAMVPGTAEMIYWTAVSLVGMGKVDEALPLFRKTFAIDRSWAEMTTRLPKSGLLPDDPALIARIVAEAPKAP